MMKNTPAGLMDQPCAMYGDAKVGHMRIDGPARKPRLEMSIERVQSLRERVLRAEGDLNTLVFQLFGAQPEPRVRSNPSDPNGLLETLDFNLDLLEADLADLQAVMDRLREGV